MNTSHGGFQNASILGSLLMAGVGFGAYATASWYFKLDAITTILVSTGAAIAFGFLYNLIARSRGAKTIHWLDFVFGLLPWDF